MTDHHGIWSLITPQKTTHSRRPGAQRARFAKVVVLVERLKYQRSQRHLVEALGTRRQHLVAPVALGPVALGQAALGQAALGPAARAAAQGKRPRSRRSRQRQRRQKRPEHHQQGEMVEIMTCGSMLSMKNELIMELVRSHGLSLWVMASKNGLMA